MSLTLKINSNKSLSQEKMLCNYSEIVTSTFLYDFQQNTCI